MRIHERIDIKILTTQLRKHAESLENIHSTAVECIKDKVGMERVVYATLMSMRMDTVIEDILSLCKEVEELK